MKKHLIRLLTPHIPEDVGDVHVSWEFPEYVQMPRTRLWYIIVSIVLALLVLYAVLTANFLFAIILLLGAFILIFQYFQQARTIPVVIAEDGVIVDSQFFPYRILTSFSIIYEPPEIKMLYLDFRSDMRQSLPIPLEDINPLKVRDALLNYLDENVEREEEELGETFERVFRLR